MIYDHQRYYCFRRHTVILSVKILYNIIGARGILPSEHILSDSINEKSTSNEKNK